MTKNLQDEETQEAKAQVSQFVEEYEGLAARLDRFLGSLRGLASNVTHLENRQRHLEHLNKEAELKVAQAEEEARVRLQNIEKGHRSLVERITEREVELSEMKRHLESQSAETQRKARDVELLRLELQRKLDSLTAIGGGKKKSEEKVPA